MSLTVGDGIAVAGLAASGAYLLCFAAQSWLKHRTALAVAKSVENGIAIFTGKK